VGDAFLQRNIPIVTCIFNRVREPYHEADIHESPNIASKVFPNYLPVIKEARTDFRDGVAFNNTAKFCW
jgi:hypothetical protein